MSYVYVLESKKDFGFYIGYTQNVPVRFVQHQNGKSSATAHRGPWQLIYYEAYLDQRDALGREKFLKSGAGRQFLRKQLSHYLCSNKCPGDRVS
jgi:putative endonuclease